MSKYRDLARQHERLGNQYAETSHREDGGLADAYSAVAEAHQYLAGILNATATERGEPEVEDVDV